MYHTANSPSCRISDDRTPIPHLTEKTHMSTTAAFTDGTGEELCNINISFAFQIKQFFEAYINMLVQPATKIINYACQ